MREVLPGSKHLEDKRGTEPSSNALLVDEVYGMPLDILQRGAQLNSKTMAVGSYKVIVNAGVHGKS